MKIPVEGHKELYRDKSTNAIINNDKNTYEEYLRTKNKTLTDKNRITQIENELGEIKNLLKKLLENT
jgi:hypothetical protein